MSNWQITFLRVTRLTPVWLIYEFVKFISFANNRDNRAHVFGFYGPVSIECYIYIDNLYRQRIRIIYTDNIRWQFTLTTLLTFCIDHVVDNLHCSHYCRFTFTVYIDGLHWYNIGILAIYIHSFRLAICCTVNSQIHNFYWRFTYSQFPSTIHIDSIYWQFTFTTYIDNLRSQFILTAYDDNLGILTIYIHNFYWESTITVYIFAIYIDNLQ